MENHPSRRQPLFTRWNAFIAHEWLQSGIANPEEVSGPFHLALLYLFELHAELQLLLRSPEDVKGPERVLNRLALLESGPVTSVIPDLLARHGGALARRHRRPVRWCGEWFSSYSHAVGSYRDRTSQLFDATLLWRPNSEVLEYRDFIKDRRETFDRFREAQEVGPARACFEFFVEYNNGCFSGRDLAAYEMWLAGNAPWDFDGTATRSPSPMGVNPISGKSLQALLEISDTTLLGYRKKAGLPIGERGKAVRWSLNDVVVLCDAISRGCPTLETCERASQLKAKCLANGQFS